MITIQLNGGLGNQLFQYALGRSLAASYDVRYDIGHLSQADTKRLCELTLFQINGNFGEYPRVGGQPLISERKRYHTLTDKLHIPAKRYKHQLLNVSDNTYIQGFWQSYKYFAHIGSVLQQEIQPSTLLDNINATFVQNMQNCNSVAIHVRRGDFQKKKLSTVHLTGFFRHTAIPLSYYYDAITLITQKLSNPIFYVFSNDIQWCKNHFIGDNYVFIDHNTGDNSYKDLILMSNCKHNIICNSTFSRWAAYLNKNQGMVVAPKKWYDVNIDINDLLLPDWIRL